MQKIHSIDPHVRYPWLFATQRHARLMLYHSGFRPGSSARLALTLLPIGTRPLSMVVQLDHDRLVAAIQGHHGIGECGGTEGTLGIIAKSIRLDGYPQKVLSRRPFSFSSWNRMIAYAPGGRSLNTALAVALELARRAVPATRSGSFRNPSLLDNSIARSKLLALSYRPIRTVPVNERMPSTVIRKSPARAFAPSRIRGNAKIAHVLACAPARSFCLHERRLGAFIPEVDRGRLATAPGDCGADSIVA